jgi:hypothetical protein
MKPHTDHQLIVEVDHLEEPNGSKTTGKQTEKKCPNVKGNSGWAPSGCPRLLIEFPIQFNVEP